MSGSPDLAIRLHGMIDPGRSAELAATAEKNGFGTVWFAENLFQRGVLPAASASAVATRSIGIGIGVFNPFNRHPSLMAMEAAALDELSCGRTILGIGVGVPPLIDRIAAFERPLVAMRDTVTIARAMPLLLAAFSLLGIGIHGPAVASGLIAGGPQLDAGAATGTARRARDFVAGALGIAAAGAARVQDTASGAVRAAARLPSGPHETPATAERREAAATVRDATRVADGGWESGDGPAPDRDRRKDRQ